MFREIKNKLLGSKEFKNASWLIIGRVIQMILSFVVSIFTARYLGPSNYGVINYAGAYVAFFTSLCTLGINSIIIKDFVDNPDEQGITIGTSLVLRIISSVLSSIMIVGIVSVVDYGETETIAVSALCSVALVFQVFDTINYWFQSRYQSKVTAIATLFAYLAISAYKIVLLILHKDVEWFAFANSVDYIFLAIFLIISYKKHNGPKWSFSWKKGKYLLSRSYHYIISGMMVAIYGQTDKLMLKQMMNETSVGYYSLASSINLMWVFDLQAIIDSMYPTIMNLYKTDKEQFEKKNRQLYAIVIYVSIFVAVMFILFGNLAIQILYGEAYLPAAEPLKIITWYTIFSYLGVARNAWIVCENKQKYLKYMYLSAVFINIILNYFMIPLWGASGAAAASLITQICTSIVLPCFIKDMRPNVKLMLQAFLLKNIK
jgi:O-antigen/teichoic acid export membrane protein